MTKRFDITSDMRPERLAATSAGCTIASRTASNSATITWAWVAACSAWVAAAASHPAYGAAAAAIATDDRPCHDPPTSPAVTEPKETAAEANSVASPSQADAAASIGPEPAPAKIKAELISGGNTE